MFFFFQIRSLTRLKSILSRKDLEKVVNAFILSCLDYCNVLCGVLSDYYFTLTISSECGSYLLVSAKKSQHISSILASCYMSVVFCVDFPLTYFP